jgi:hypothetical protein
MWVTCRFCHVGYEDEVSWTICPHGPLWAAVEAYCRKHDLVDCKICKLEKENNMKQSEDFDPTKMINEAKNRGVAAPENNINNIKIEKDSAYREHYVNSVQVNVSLWDFYLTLGTISNEGEKIKITNIAGIFISPQQAKALSNVLVQNLKQYEDTFGPIKLTPKDQAVQ